MLCVCLFYFHVYDIMSVPLTVHSHGGLFIPTPSFPFLWTFIPSNFHFPLKKNTIIMSKLRGGQCQDLATIPYFHFPFPPLSFGIIIYTYFKYIANMILILHYFAEVCKIV